MKVVILAGGFGTRLSELTDVIPKPLVPVGDKPIIWHIMNHYAGFGYKDFLIALGYKGEKIKDYFLNYRALNSDFTVDLDTGNCSFHDASGVDWNVTLVETGHNTMTGGRLKRLEKYLNGSPFLLTYGDGLCNVDIGRLVDFHQAHGKMASMTAVRPAARFGELSLDEDLVTEFKEKPQLQQGWINGGFFVMETKILDYILDDTIMLEQEPLSAIVELGELMAYKHNGFWHCMDTKRDFDYLNKIWRQGAPWQIKV